MKYKVVVSVLLALSSVTLCGADVLADSPPAASADNPSAEPMRHADFCLIAGTPPSSVSYSPIKRVHLAKSTYGSARQILEQFVEDTSALGADAVINYSGYQRFGFWPWRMVHPVVKGLAIKWNQAKPDCKSVGGSTLKEMMAADTKPSK